MTTVVNTPSAGGGRDDAGAGTIIAVVVLVIVVILFFVFALPYLRGGRSTGTDTNTGGAVVPEQIDVNVDTPAGGANPAQ